MPVFLVECSGPSARNILQGLKARYLERFARGLKSPPPKKVREAELGSRKPTRRAGQGRLGEQARKTVVWASWMFAYDSSRYQRAERCSNTWLVLYLNGNTSQENFAIKPVFDKRAGQQF